MLTLLEQGSKLNPGAPEFTPCSSAAPRELHLASTECVSPSRAKKGQDVDKDRMSLSAASENADHYNQQEALGEGGRRTQSLSATIMSSPSEEATRSVSQPMVVTKPSTTEPPIEVHTADNATQSRRRASARGRGGRCHYYGRGKRNGSSATKPRGGGKQPKTEP